MKLGSICARTCEHRSVNLEAWEPKLERYLAHASMDKKVLIWDLETESIKFEIDINSHVIHLAWNDSDINLMYLLQNNTCAKQRKAVMNRLLNWHSGDNLFNTAFESLIAKIICLTQLCRLKGL